MRLRFRIACAALTPLMVAAKPPIELQPSSPWVVDYAENSCRLIRNFGEGKSLTKLAFESEAPGDTDMLVFGRPLETYQDRVSARFVPLGVEPMDGKVAQTVDKGQPAILWSHVEMLPDDIRKQRKEESKRYRQAGIRPPAVSLAEQAQRKLQRQQFAAAVTGVEIDTRRNRAVVLETGSLGGAMKAFDQCGRDSLQDWGVDPDVDDRIVRPVWAVNPDRWLFASDYPSEMLRFGKESQVAVRLLVDASGKITKCTSLSHYEDAEFNRLTCERIVERARFEPAELADGTKVPSYYTQKVVFQIGH